MWRRLFLFAFPPAMLLRASPAGLKVRTRVEPFKGSGIWQPVEYIEPVEASRSALILCDVWDRHWCRGATLRVNQLVKKMAPVVNRVRSKGVLIIHAPSETMSSYEQAPQRLAAIGLPKVAPPAPLDLDAPPIPVDSSDGGCDTAGESFFKAWTKEHPEIPIGDEDLITDQGEQVYSALKARGIQHLLVAGVHTNMCILNRSFAIKQMTKWGVRCILLRDLTDAMYNPQDKPYVSHERGTEMVVEYIEQYWCPTALSADLLAALG